MILGNQTTKKIGQMFRSMPYLMTTLFVLFLFLTLFASSAWTQDGHKGQHPNPEKQLKKLTKRLGLTEAQRKKFSPILEQKSKKIKTLREQMKEVRQAARGQIEAELTPEQAEMYKQLREKRKIWKEYKKRKPEHRHKKKHKKDDQDDNEHENND
ncbi:MAG: periplasmic heavy metal sensor [Nitrospirales bacterium]|nr:periplasmic heavy metal sensor [Nitrospirales bacterium]